MSGDSPAVRRSEKDSGNESEPEINSCDFSKLNISPKPIHARPSAVRILSKKSALAQQLERDNSTLQSSAAGDSASEQTGESPSVFLFTNARGNLILISIGNSF